MLKRRNQRKKVSYADIQGKSIPDRWGVGAPASRWKRTPSVNSVAADVMRQVKVKGDRGPEIY